MNNNEKITAIYVRVSTVQQTTRSQRGDLKRWAEAQEPNGQVRWYEDKATGKNMDRPGWQKLQKAIDGGQVSKLVVWRLDRLGRTASGLCTLFEDLQAKKVRLVSLRDSIDLGTASGRLMANMLASIAAYETELRGERVKSGQIAARSAGKRWGGSVKGRRLKVTDQQVKAIVEMKSRGDRTTNIAKVTGLDRSTIYRIIQRVQEGHIAIEG